MARRWLAPGAGLTWRSDWVCHRPGKEVMLGVYSDVAHWFIGSVPMASATSMPTAAVPATAVPAATPEAGKTDRYRWSPIRVTITVAISVVRIGRGRIRISRIGIRGIGRPDI